MKKSNKILGNHKKVGKKFIPPTKFKIPNMEELNYVDDLLPELIWIPFVLDKLGAKRGIEVVSSFIVDAFSIKRWEHPIDFSFLSAFKLFNDEEIQLLTSCNSFSNYKNDLSKGLEIFNIAFPENPLSFLFTETNRTLVAHEIIIIKKIIIDNFVKQSHGAMITQAVSHYSINKTGKVHYPKGFIPPDLSAIFYDFDSEASRESVGFVRTQISSSFMLSSDKFDKSWPSYFWNRGQIIEKPFIESFSNDEEELKEEMKNPKRSPLIKYINLLQESLKERWNLIPKDIYENHVVEVITSLLSRQTSLAKRIAKNPGIWDFHIGPIVLRTMVDVHINLAWILTNPKDRSKKFIDYGLGQEKLQIEHLKNSEVEEELREDLELMIEAKTSWLNAQHFSFLTTVDVGSWSGVNTREMAEKSGCESLYKYVYSPYSSCVHNTWNHIGKFNLKPSDNPLHKLFRLPYDLEINPELDILIKSAKYFSRTIELIDDKFNINSNLEDVYDYLLGELGDLNEKETV